MLDDLPDLDFSDMPGIGVSKGPEIIPEAEAVDVGEMPIGVYADMSNEDYHRSDALSRGGISILKQSATKYWYARHAARQVKKRHFDVGSFFSDLITFAKGHESHDFIKKHYVREPGVNLRTKVGKSELEMFYKTLASYQVGINHDDWDMVMAMRDSAMMNELVRGFVEHPSTKAEHSHFAIKDVEIVADGERVIDKVHVRVRPDLKNPELGFVADVKTLATNLRWRDSVVDHGYHLQQVMYSDVISMTEFPVNQFWFFVTEKTSENPVTRVRHLEPWHIEKGQGAYQAGLEKYAVLQRTGDWFESEITEKPRWVK